ncbi:hypothetical protein VTL71DRAFT_14132 [Oculimacula yallundae]|uniref:Uncharacterized protein n=1 Tax=Oculimacula yallundae TaxID=86028 RepID=A0ABR4CHL2_9HELO
MCTQAQVRMHRGYGSSLPSPNLCYPDQSCPLLRLYVTYLAPTQVSGPTRLVMASNTNNPSSLSVPAASSQHRDTSQSATNATCLLSASFPPLHAQSSISHADQDEAFEAIRHGVNLRNWEI